jgi:hypothetical protein
LPEAKSCAAGLRDELKRFVPRLIRHSFPDDASSGQAIEMIDGAVRHIGQHGAPSWKLGDETFVGVDANMPPFLPALQPTAEAFRSKANRYSTMGTGIRRVMVRAAWNNMAIAELRDLNRHRTGFRFSPLIPMGFYLPPQVDHAKRGALMDMMRLLIGKLASSAGGGAAYVYGLLLGTQVPFEHSLHLDKFIYEIELRTGMGAHFRYAEHLAAAGAELLKCMPELAPFIKIGAAEPE